MTEEELAQILRDINASLKVIAASLELVTKEIIKDDD